MPLSSKHLTGKIVLVVEDNLTSKEYFEAALKRVGIKTLWAMSGDEAVRIFKENRNISLVLMDLHLPIMNGFEATRIIRGLDKDIPIVVQSAFVLSGEEKRSYEAGCNVFIPKPVRINELIENLANLIK